MTGECVYCDGPCVVQYDPEPTCVLCSELWHRWRIGERDDLHSLWEIHKTHAELQALREAVQKYLASVERVGSGLFGEGGWDPPEDFVELREALTPPAAEKGG